ncbi:MAG TPA: polymer-forming cytoskeletal protein [Fontimonas sp.]
MFGGNSSKAGGAPANVGVDTLIGRQTEILGDIRFTGGLHVDGKIKGKVIASADKASALSVSENGMVEGDVRVPNVVLNGTVIGDVHASQKIAIAAKARVTGNVYYRIIEMESGAQVNGQLVHDVGTSAAETIGNATSTAASQADELSEARRVKGVAGV